LSCNRGNQIPAGPGLGCGTHRSVPTVRHLHEGGHRGKKSQGLKMEGQKVAGEGRVRRAGSDPALGGKAVAAPKNHGPPRKKPKPKY